MSRDRRKREALERGLFLQFLEEWKEAVPEQLAEQNGNHEDAAFSLWLCFVEETCGSFVEFVTDELKKGDTP